MVVNMTSEEVSELQATACAMRKDVLDMGIAAGKSGIHLGGSFSCIEIVAALYFKVMAFDAAKPDSPTRDRLVFSMGHGEPAL